MALCNRRWMTLEKYFKVLINPLNAELNPICRLLALLGAHHIFHVSRIRVKVTENIRRNGSISFGRNTCNFTTYYSQNARVYAQGHMLRYCFDVKETECVRP